eukprot:6084307-Alexandrium_andersonii.AAC.1
MSARLIGGLLTNQCGHCVPNPLVHQRADRVSGFSGVVSGASSVGVVECTAFAPTRVPALPPSIYAIVIAATLSVNSRPRIKGCSRG